MRKFLMVAAVLAVTACGEKKAEEATDTAAMAAPTAPAMAPMDSMAKPDSMKKDSAVAPAAKP